MGIYPFVLKYIVLLAFFLSFFLQKQGFVLCVYDMKLAMLRN